MTLTNEQVARYSRHLIMPEVGVEGQEKLLAANVLLIGAGGLGSPLGLYLAAAGVGHLGLVDFDVVDQSNLQRQVIHSTANVGKLKVESAKARIAEINPAVQVDAYNTRLSSENIMDLIRPYDLVIDGTDNFPTRYLVNDACVFAGKPNIYGSIFRFEGQATVFKPKAGPCYRCLYPEPPPPGMVPSCAEGGVLGILPGIIGMIQATEAVKLIIGKGRPLIGRLLLYNALEMSFRELKLKRAADCSVCGDHPTVTSLIDYDEFCGIRGEEESRVGAGLAPAPNGISEITAKDLKELLDRKTPVTVVDVREQEEWNICHIEGAKLIPLGTLADRVNELDSADDIVLHCRTGARSAKALKILESFGFRKLKNLRGGIHAWATDVDPSMPKY